MTAYINMRSSTGSRTSVTPTTRAPELPERRRPGRRWAIFLAVGGLLVAAGAGVLLYDAINEPSPSSSKVDDAVSTLDRAVIDLERNATVVGDEPVSTLDRAVMDLERNAAPVRPADDVGRVRQPGLPDGYWPVSTMTELTQPGWVDSGKMLTPGLPDGNWEMDDESGAVVPSTTPDASGMHPGLPDGNWRPEIG